MFPDRARANVQNPSAECSESAVNKRPRAAHQPDVGLTDRRSLWRGSAIHSERGWVPCSLVLTLFMFFGLLSALLAAFDRLLLNAGLTLGSPVRRLLRRRQARLAAASDGGNQTQFSLDADTTSAKRPILLYFHSSGLFLPYYIGVAEYLKAHYDCSDIMCAGVSGGYAGASSIVLDIDPLTHWRAVDGMRQRAASRFFGSFLLSSHDMIHCGYLPLLRERADELLPRLATGRMRLGCTQLWPWPMLRAVWLDTFHSVKALCHACTCSMRVIPIFRLPGRLGDGSLVVDGFLGCCPEQLLAALHSAAPSAPLPTIITISAVPCEADLAPSRVLGGLSQVVRLPSRKDFDAWQRQGWLDAESKARTLFEAKGMRPLVETAKSRGGGAALLRSGDVSSAPSTSRGKGRKSRSPVR